MAMTAYRLPQVLTHDLAAEVMAQSRSALMSQQSQTWVLDASLLDQFDSSALAVLLGLRRFALESKAELQVQGAPQRLTQLAGLYGVAGLLHLTSH